jgi:ATP-binding cassette, subfamily B, bacterial
MGFGPGTFGGGPSSVQANAAAGLPYAGVPGKLGAEVDKILAVEPTHPEPDVHFDRATWDRRPFTLRTFLRPHAAALFGALLLVILETIALQAGPLLTQIGIDHGVEKGNKGVLLTVAFAFLASVVISAFAGFVRTAFTGKLGEKLMYELRVRVFSHLERQSLSFYTTEKAGVLMTRMTSDIEALSQLFQEGLVNFLVQALTLVVITVILFVLDVHLALVTVALVVPLTFLLSVWFRRASDEGYRRVRDRIADVLSDLAESLAGIRVIAAYNRRRRNVANHVNVVGEHLDANLFTARAGALYAPGTEAIGVIAQAVLLAVGGTMVVQGDLSIGTVSAFLLYVTAFFAPIQQLVALYTSYQQGQASIRKLRELLATEPDVREALDAVDLPSVEGDIVLEHVTFGYDPTQPVLHDVSLHIPAGESLAVVGTTGAGKSTIAKLVARFYDPDAGRVLIDGRDLRTLTLTSLRRQLGVVPQEPFLFHGTIRDNVAFGRPDATDDEVRAACVAVGIGDIVERLPGGVNAPVHERGSSLSAGERQLLALARAFLAQPRVLVLDEATSNLDLRSEATIERALDTVLRGRTAVIIAHRLATAMRCDRIAVVEGGEIVELGSPDELVAQGGRFADMYASWIAHLDPRRDDL